MSPFHQGLCWPWAEAAQRLLSVSEVEGHPGTSRWHPTFLGAQEHLDGSEGAEVDPPGGELLPAEGPFPLFQNGATHGQSAVLCKSRCTPQPLQLVGQASLLCSGSQLPKSGWCRVPMPVLRGQLCAGVCLQKTPWAWDWFSGGLLVVSWVTRCRLG